MKKQLTFALPLAAAMAVAAALRVWQRATAFEPDTGLLIPGMPATWCLTGLLLLAAAALGLLAWRTVKDREFRSYLDAFSCAPLPVWPVYVLAGALMVAAGLLGLREWALGLANQTSRLILSVGLLPAGLGTALVGWLNAQAQEGKGRFAWPLLLPGYCGCLWLICAYQAYAGDPNEMEYLFCFLGMVCAVVCCYLTAAFSFEKPVPLPCLWTGAAALLLLATAVVDQVAAKAWPALLTTLGYGLYLAAQLMCLLSRCDRPAPLELWEPPAETGEAEIEVNDHE